MARISIGGLGFVASGMYVLCAHHLVLVVRTTQMDLVLDNLDPNILMPPMTYRRWVRIETPQNPRPWARVQLSSISDEHGNRQ